MPNDPANNVIPLRDDRLIVIDGADHPWATRHQIGIRALNGQIAVLRKPRLNTPRMVDRPNHHKGFTLDTRL